MSKQFAVTDDSVVVVLGSGAGGGVLANELAQRGHDVVCLEAGRRLAPRDIVNNEAEMFGKLTWLDPRIGSGQAIPPFPVWTCKTVGGTTTHWTASCPRLQAHEFQARSTYGKIADTTLVDWPIDLQELNPYYSLAEDRMGVTGTHGIPRLPGNNNYKVLAAGARTLGYTQVDTNNVAINSRPRDGRAACLQIGFCTSGCVVQAKWSTLYTEIPRAERTGHF
ncbi:MAG: NAD(P)-binding protein, partial [Lysobacterales bacterium]